MFNFPFNVYFFQFNTLITSLINVSFYFYVYLLNEVS